MSRPLSAVCLGAVFCASSLLPAVLAAQPASGPVARLEGGTVVVQGSRTISSAAVPPPFVMTIAEPPGGDGTIEADALLVFSTAAVMAEGQQVGLLNRTGAFCRDLSHGIFTIPAAQMAMLAADGQVTIDVLAQPYGFCVTPTTQSVVLRYPSRSDGVTFSSVVVGRLQERRLVVRNDGTQALSFTTQWTGPADVTVSPSSADVPPGGLVEVHLVFAPAQAGALSGSLRIGTNDPEHGEFVVPVQGTGVGAPRASLQAEALTASLFTGGRASRSIRIENQGGSELSFELLPAGADEFAGPPGSRVLLVQDAAPWGTASNEAVLAAANRSFETVTSTTLEGIDLNTCRRVILAGDQPVAFYDRIRTQMARLEAFANQGGVLEVHAAGQAFGGAPMTSLDLPGGVSAEALSFTRNRATRGHVLLDGFDDTIIWVQDLSDPWEFFGTPFSYAHLDNLPGEASVAFREGDYDDPRPTLATYALGQGKVLVSCQPLELLAKTNPLLLHNVSSFGWDSPGGLPWLSVSLARGGIAPGGAATSTASIDAGGLGSSQRSGKLVLRTNDPEHPLQEIPAALQATAAPDLRAGLEEVRVTSRVGFYRRSARTSQDVGLPAPPGGIGSIRVKVSGRYGYQFHEAGGYAFAKADGMVLPSFHDVSCPSYCAVESLDVTLDPTAWASMVANGAVRIEVQNSDHVDTHCDKWHEAILRYPREASEIVFEPAFVGATSLRTLELSNAGVLPLSVSGVVVSPGNFTAASEPFVLASGATRSLEVRWTAAAGSQEGLLRIESDDPYTPALEIPLRGEGIPIPPLAFSPSMVSEHLVVGQHSQRTLSIANDSDRAITFRLAVGDIRRPVPASAIESHPRGVLPAAAAAAGASQGVPVTYELLGDDMESGPGEWTHQADTPGGLDTWALTTQRASSGRTSWTAQQILAGGGDFLQSPLVDLRGVSAPTLTFRHWHNFGQSYDVGCDLAFSNGGVVDMRRVEESSWTRLSPVGDYLRWIDFWNACNPLADQAAYAGDLPGSAFAAAQFDLASFAGSATHLRFHTGWTCYSADPEGWFIDDVRVTASALDWLAVTAAQNTLAPHSTMEIAIDFDAASLPPGSYSATLKIESDDAPALVVPLRLGVFDLFAAMDVRPETINPRSHGRTLTSYLELPNGLDPHTVELSTVRMEGSPALEGSGEVGDIDADGVPDLVLKFDRASVTSALSAGESVTLALTGALQDGTTFAASDVVRVTSPHVEAPNGGETLAPGGVYAVRFSSPSDWEGVSYDLDVSFNGGVSWEALAAGLPQASFDWTVPNRVSSEVLVRVRASDASGPLASDQSDAVSSIGNGTTAVADSRNGSGLSVWPNPSEVRTGLQIGFSLPRPGHVAVRIFDVGGHLVRVLTEGTLPAGAHHWSWNGMDQTGRQVAAGVYFCRLETEPGSALVRRLVMLR